MSNRKDTTAHLIAGSYKMSQYFPPHKSSERNIKLELDLSSYATKTDLKSFTHVNDSNFALKKPSSFKK